MDRKMEIALKLQEIAALLEVDGKGGTIVAGYIDGNGDNNGVMLHGKAHDCVFVTANIVDKLSFHANGKVKEIMKAITQVTKALKTARLNAKPGEPLFEKYNITKGGEDNEK